MWRHWTTFEWHGWSFYVPHWWRVTVETWFQDPRQLRVASSLPSWGLGWWLWIEPNPFVRPGFVYIEPWIGDNTLATMFFVHAVGMVWRVYALSSSMLWSSFFGMLGIALYIGYPLLIWMGLHYPTGAGFAMMAWGLVQVWILSRIGNGEDRSRP